MKSATEAQELLRQGRIAEAERAFAKLLEEAPDHPAALNFLALAALRDGRAAAALPLLQRADTAEPQSPVTQHHLGLVYEALGDEPSATAAFERAVRINPALYVSRLHLAAALERGGDQYRALVHYARSLKDAQSRGRWVDRDSTPVGLRPLVERAVTMYRTGRPALLAQSFEPLAQKFGRAGLARVERCLRIYLGLEEPNYPDPRQRPTFLFFPDLPATPYLERSLYPWAERFEQATPAIREELLALLPSPVGSEHVFTSPELEQENLRGKDFAPSWNGYYFFRHGQRRDENCSRCPRTTRELEAMPLAQVRDHAPEVLFSVFTPGTHLLPHRGVTNTRVVGHLPLIIPEDCALNVGGELHEWREGQFIVFDDTYEHEAWNRSDRTRVVLICDLWHPLLTDIERAAVASLVEAIGDFRAATDAD